MLCLYHLVLHYSFLLKLTCTPIFYMRMLDVLHLTDFYA